MFELMLYCDICAVGMGASHESYTGTRGRSAQTWVSTSSKGSRVLWLTGVDHLTLPNHPNHAAGKEQNVPLRQNCPVDCQWDEPLACSRFQISDSRNLKPLRGAFMAIRAGPPQTLNPKR